jgi:UTP--glucose-1-phosphate uridylyltransferase
MMPATRAIPKELLPVGRKPAIAWIIEEALEAGIDRIIVISSPRKPAIDAYLLSEREPRKTFGRQKRTRQRGSSTESVPSDPFQIYPAQPDQIISNPMHTNPIEIIYQPEPKGLGDAVRIAHSVLGSEPFALLLPDELLIGGSRLLSTMLDDFERTGQSGVSLLEVDRSEISSYGCAAIAPSSYGDERLKVTGCVEKPEPFAAPSCYALCGRYVLGHEVLSLLGQIEPDESGEIQITTALNRAAGNCGLAGFVVREEDGRIDIGNWEGWLEANSRLFANEQPFEAMAIASSMTVD